MTYYEILGIPEDAPGREIIAAYRKLCAEYSPNKLNGNNGPIKDIEEAWEILKDDRKKAEYDKSLKWNKERKDEAFMSYSNRNDLSSNEVKYAGFWIRVVAWLIDYIIMLILALLVASVLVTIFNTEFTSESDYDLFVQFTSIVSSWLYFSVLESSSLQASLGKKAVGIKVVDKSMGKITYGQATSRFFGKMLSTITLFIGFIMIAFNKEKQGLHDALAGSYIIYSR
jgi:uncharacterized RDD family membrane protein YckC